MTQHPMESLLNSVEKPVRYTGNELNMCVKDRTKAKVKFAFCFPDTYEVGMSHLGMRILYHVLNKRDDTYCERVFSPWPDMEQKLRDTNTKLFSLETYSSLDDFDVVGFTLQYEMSYSNILNMLELSNIPLRASDRDDSFPLVVAGGPCAFNPEPLAPFLDVVMLGDGEDSMNQLIDVLIKTKGLPKTDRLVAIANEVDGAYIPSFFDVTYYDNNKIKSVVCNRDDVPKVVTKAIVKDLDSAVFPTDIIVPYMGIVHDRITMEIFRGCTRGCRFCQAGYIYRPVRERKLDTLKAIAEQSVKETGYEEISLCSLSSGDYPELGELITHLISSYGKDGISVALPSLRVDSFASDYAKEVQKVRKTGLTFAPEAGSQRLRDVINKGVTKDDLISSVKDAFENGWSRVKLYFMIGLPTETYEDLDAIVELADSVVESYLSLPKEKRMKGFNVTVSASTFVPKAFTPFQFEKQDDIETIYEKQRYLQNKLKRKFVSFNWHDPKTSVLEACFARGDRRLADVLEKAHKLGCKFDGWNEYFDYELWMKAFDELGISPEYYTSSRDYDEVLPYDHLDAMITKDYLIKENQEAKKAQCTKDCRLGCNQCGLESVCR